MDSSGTIVRSQIVVDGCFNIENTVDVPETSYISLVFPSTELALNTESGTALSKSENNSIRVDMNRLKAQKTLSFKCTYSLPNDQVHSFNNVKMSAKMKIQTTQTQLVILCETLGTMDVDLSDVSILVSTDTHASNTITKPVGIWNNEKKKILWKQEHVALKRNAPEKFLAQWTVQEPSKATTIPIKYLLKSSNTQNRYSVKVNLGKNSIPIDATDRLENSSPLSISLLLEPSVVASS